MTLKPILDYIKEKKSLQKEYFIWWYSQKIHMQQAHALNAINFLIALSFSPTNQTNICTDMKKVRNSMKTRFSFSQTSAKYFKKCYLLYLVSYNIGDLDILVLRMQYSGVLSSLWSSNERFSTWQSCFEEQTRERMNSEIRGKRMSTSTHKSESNTYEELRWQG